MQFNFFVNRLSKPFFSLLVLSLALNLSHPALALAECESVFENAPLHNASYTSKVRPQTLDSQAALHRDTLPLWKTEGFYIEAPREEYEAYFNGDTAFKMPEVTGSVTAHDVDVNLITSSSREIYHLVRKGQNNARNLHYVTSAAGAWTRGRGRYKGLQPYNIEELVSAEEFRHLNFIDQILNKAGDPEAMMRIAGMDKSQLSEWLSPELWADQVVEKYIDEEADILIRAMQHKDATNPLDLKFALVASASRKADAYISFDVWLSLKTHPELADYITWLSHNFEQRRFHTDNQIDWKLKMALRSYFAESARRGETHVFGYQEGFHGLDMKTGAPLLDTDLLGEGTGMLTHYYRISGRMDELKAMGKSFFIFDNIESLTDISLIAGAHLHSKKPISSVIVPVGPGYSGGFPYLTQINGKKSISMIETSILPKEQQQLLPQGGEFFFSGTIAMDFDAVGDKIVITETKKKPNGEKYLRLKYMIQDATQFVESAAIVGPTPNMHLTNGAGPVYDNFKILTEFYQNGPRMVDKIRNGPLKRDSNH